MKSASADTEKAYHGVSGTLLQRDVFSLRTHSAQECAVARPAHPQSSARPGTRTGGGREASSFVVSMPASSKAHLSSS